MSKTFALSGYIYRQDESVATLFYLVGFSSNTTGMPALTASNVQHLQVNTDIKESSIFPTDNFTSLTRLKIDGWKTLSSFVVGAGVLSSLLELQINNTNVSAISQAFTALTDLMLVGNLILTSISNSMSTLLRMVIISCPITVLTAQNGVTTLHLEDTMVSSIPTSMTALKYLYVSPKSFNQNINTQALTGLSILATRKDVYVTSAPLTHICLVDPR
jgi:hypothetical protein